MTAWAQDAASTAFIQAKHDVNPLNHMQDTSQFLKKWISESDKCRYSVDTYRLMFQGTNSALMFQTLISDSDISIFTLLDLDL